MGHISEFIQTKEKEKIMANLSNEERNALKESGFWDLISGDVTLYDLNIIDKEKFQECVVEASRLHKEREIRKNELEKEHKLEMEKAKADMLKNVLRDV